MSRASGSRSRDGCSNCRRRKRRCDETKPVCLTCRRTGSDCIYPVAGSASNPLKFIISASSGHFIIPSHENKTTFLHLSSNEVPTFCPGIADLGHIEHHEPCRQGSPGVNHDGPCEQQAQLCRSIPRSISQFQGTPGRETLWTVEGALMQYYAEVVCSSRVYVQTDRNFFRISVIPRVIFNQGPLFSTVMAMSAAEWGQNVVADGRDYNALSARYKVRALHQLQHDLSNTMSAEENLLTCLLLASLEISEGSRPTWLQHLQGALALLDSFAPSIDPSVVKFVLQYFRFRYIMMETTQPRGPGLDDDDDSYDHAMSRIAEVEYGLSSLHSGDDSVDEHIGCSMELVDIINQISALSMAVGVNGPELPIQQRHLECQNLELKILHLSPHINDTSNEYLLQSAESFRVAAQIYLRLTCLDASINQQSVLEPHEKLLNCLSDIIVEGQTRRSFPMWPLFIAGCACTTDQQRKTVLELFAILDGQWPLSNIAAVWNAVRTVWHTRDLAVSPSSGKQDWQEIIHKFGWKLSLS